MASVLPVTAAALRQRISAHVVTPHVAVPRDDGRWPKEDGYGLFTIADPHAAAAPLAAPSRCGECLEGAGLSALMADAATGWRNLLTIAD